MAARAHTRPVETGDSPRPQLESLRESPLTHSSTSFLVNCSTAHHAASEWRLASCSIPLCKTNWRASPPDSKDEARSDFRRPRQPARGLSVHRLLVLAIACFAQSAVRHCPGYNDRPPCRLGNVLSFTEKEMKKPNGTSHALKRRKQSTWVSWW